MTFSIAKQVAYILEVGTQGAGDLATSAKSVSIFCHCLITEQNINSVCWRHLINY